MKALPPGLTGIDPIPYGYRRWNGTVWPDIHVDRYNHEVARIWVMHTADYDTQRLVDGLYNMARGFDVAASAQLADRY